MHKKLGIDKCQLLVILYLTIKDDNDDEQETKNSIWYKVGENGRI